MQAFCNVGVVPGAVNAAVDFQRLLYVPTRTLQRRRVLVGNEHMRHLQQRPRELGNRTCGGEMRRGGGWVGTYQFAEANKTNPMHRVRCDITRSP